MSDEAQPKWMTWTGRVLSGLVAFALIASAGIKFAHKPEAVAMFTQKLGWPEPMITVLGILELACLALYLMAPTAVLGAILVVGYLGGAVGTHVRVADNFVAPLLVGIFAWAGLYLRDARIRALVPLKK